ncbi:MAG: mechanosensitive ion channel domain-containing protein [Gemmatimonadaceae bacterium]
MLRRSRSDLPLVLMRSAGVAMLVAGAAGSRLQAQRDTLRAPPPGDSALAAARGAPVVYAPDTLFRLYGNLGPFSAAERAAAAEVRLRQVAKAIAAGESISIMERGAYSELTVGDVVLMTVLDDDAVPVGASHTALASRYAARIRSAVDAGFARHSTQALLVDAGYALLATAALALLLWIVSVAFARAQLRVEALQRVRFSAIKIQDFELLSAGRLSTLLLGAARVARIVVILLLLYVYVPLVLGFFPYTAELSQRIAGYALHPFAVAWAAFITYLPNLFYLAAGVIIVRYLLALMHLVFGAIGSGAITINGFYADWADPTYKILRVLVFAFSATILYPYLPGASTDAFKGVSIFVGVLFSLGSSAAIGNMVAGVVLTYTRGFQRGDRVQIGDTIGDIVEKTLLVTRLRTPKNVAVTIPNGAVLAAQVMNFSTLAATNGLVLHTTVTIGYDAPWRQVQALLIEAARCTDHILPEPAPFVLQTSLDDYYVSYELNAFSSRADLMAATYSGLHQNIQETFNAAGVEIMSPHYRAVRDGNQTTIPAPDAGTLLSP